MISRFARPAETDRDNPRWTVIMPPTASLPLAGAGHLLSNEAKDCSNHVEKMRPVSVELSD